MFWYSVSRAVLIGACSERLLRRLRGDELNGETMKVRQTRAGEIVDSLHSHPSISADSAEKPCRATVLADTFPETVAQGFVPVVAKAFR